MTDVEPPAGPPPRDPNQPALSPDLEPGADGEDQGDLDLTPSEAAIADAVALLSGPALLSPDPRPDPDELEAGWAAPARAGLDALLTDLDGKRVGLAISGGGSLGSFEAGVVRFLYDHGRVTPVALTGNSAGALNAAKLAHGTGPGGTPIAAEVERLWRSMRINPDMWEPEPWLERIIASAQWASALRGQIAGSNPAANAMRIAVRVVGSLVRRPEETDGTFDAIKAALDAQSLLSLRPVVDLVRAELDPAQVAASGIKLRVGAVSLESGELRYITEAGDIHDRHDQPLGLAKVPLADGILASASIPIAFPPVRLGDEHYVDGGAREILPLELLVDHLEVERPIAIAASSPNIERVGSFADRTLLDILRRVTAEIAPNETLRKELSPPGGWPAEARLVVPEFEVHDAMTIDPALIAISMDYGWLRAADVLLDLPPRVANLSNELTRTRVSLRRLAGPLPTLFGSDDRTGAAVDRWEDGEGTLTARLREQVVARREAGGPLPPSLLAWLDAG